MQEDRHEIRQRKEGERGDEREGGKGQSREVYE